MRLLVHLIVPLMMVGCAALPTESAPRVGRTELLTGAALFGHPIAAAPDTSAEILATDAEMDAFVERLTADATTDGARLQRLVNGMERAGLLALGYDAEATLSATEVFHLRRGNCLAATNLFIALARRAGLNVQFQHVEIPPMWIADAGYFVLDQHVNAVIHDVWHASPRAAPDYVLDFNRAEAQAGFEQYPVSDAHAFALFFNNLAVERLRAKDTAGALAKLARAIALDPRSVPAWVNLGALYSKREQYEHARAAYLQAIRIEPYNKPALSNLAGLHEFLGNSALAARYQRAVVQYQARNPYYQYALAREAYRQTTYADALQAIDRAIRLKRDDHQFYLMRGAVLVKLGDYTSARESLEKALQYAPFDDLKQRYAAKLDALAHL